MEYIPAHIPGHPAAHPHHADVYQRTHHAAQYIAGQHEQGVAAHCRHIHVAGALPVALLHHADGLAGKLGAQQVAQVAQQGARQEEQYQPAVGHQIAQDTPQRPLGVPWLDFYPGAGSRSWHLRSLLYAISPIWTW